MAAGGGEGERRHMGFLSDAPGGDRDRSNLGTALRITCVYASGSSGSNCGGIWEDGDKDSDIAKEEGTRRCRKK